MTFLWHVGIEHYLVLAALLFAIGVVGALVRKNALIVLMSIELMLAAGNLMLLAFSWQRGDGRGHTLAMLVIALAAAETAIGLGIVVAIFRAARHASVDRMKDLRG